MVKNKKGNGMNKIMRITLVVVCAVCFGVPVIALQEVADAAKKTTQMVSGAQQKAQQNSVSNAAAVNESIAKAQAQVLKTMVTNWINEKKWTDFGFFLTKLAKQQGYSDAMVGAALADDLENRFKNKEAEEENQKTVAALNENTLSTILDEVILSYSKTKRWDALVDLVRLVNDKDFAQRAARIAQKSGAPLSEFLAAAVRRHNNVTNYPPPASHFVRKNFYTITSVQRINMEDLARVLLDNGASANGTDSSGRTLLLIALSNLGAERRESWGRTVRSNEVRQRCIDYEDYYVLSDTCNTVIVPAALENMVQLLVEKGARINDAIDADGNGALHIAILNGSPELVQFLVHKGANVELLNNAGESPLVISIRRGLGAHMDALLKKANVNAADKKGVTPLMVAIPYGRSANELLDKGARVETKDASGMTPLMVGAQHGHYVQELLDRGANVDAKDSSGRSAIALANDEGLRRFLQYAVDHNDIRILSRLAEHLSDFDRAVGPEGITALMIAVNANNGDLAQKILEHGADIYKKDASGKTVFDHAQEKKLDTMVKKLINWRLFFAVSVQSGEGLEKALAIDKALAAGADINVTDSTGKTPLIQAVIAGQINTVKYLLSKGASWTIKDNAGKTALDYARDNKKADIEQVLMGWERDNDKK